MVIPNMYTIFKAVLSHCLYLYNFVQAYKDWERIHGKEKKLPGIPLTMDQLVFVSHGQVKNIFILFFLRDFLGI